MFCHIVFSFGFVLVDLLTDGQGEDIRWEVTYQKKDAETGKMLLSFGLDSAKLRSILSQTKGRPHGLVELAVEVRALGICFFFFPFGAAHFFCARSVAARTPLSALRSRPSAPR